MTTGVVLSDELKHHETGSGHPEAPARIDAVTKAVAHPALAGRLETLAPRAAAREEILMIHWERLYREVVDSATRDKTLLDADTVASRRTAELAHLASGTVLTGVEAVMSGKVDNAFAFSRPPGHHAKPDKAMGFCVFNNVAIAAKFAQQRFKVTKILVVDFDVHHGNGTQKAFYTSPEVLFVSTHQWPHYPGTGALSEVGKDDGEGFTINVPMSAGMGDAELVRVFRDIVIPVGREFAPELILVSAGFDAHRDDPLGGMCVTKEGFGRVSELLVGLASDVCSGRTVFALEGGYNLTALEESIVSSLGALSGVGAQNFEDEDVDDSLVKGVREVHSRYWKSLAT